MSFLTLFRLVIHATDLKALKTTMNLYNVLDTELRLYIILPVIRSGMMQQINIKQPKNCNRTCVALCCILAISTVLFAVLAVRNARPLECEEFQSDQDGNTYCMVLAGSVQ